MKKLLALLLALAMVFALAACGGTEAPAEEAPADDAAAEAPAEEAPAEVANKDKPLVWFNRQPSNSSTGELDMDALTFNEDTYYVGFDANQGAELQGTMVKDYIEANIDTIDRTATALSDMSWPSVTSDTMTLLPVPAASAPLWALLLMQTALSTAILSAPTLTAPLLLSLTALWR